MKYVYFDCSAGASGDMILAALLSLGVPVEDFKKAINSLKLNVDIQVKKAKSKGFSGLKVKVLTSAVSIERNFLDVEQIITRSKFSPEVKEKALAIFRRLFQAESRVHGTNLKQIHLHEAAADDALVDIVGSCWLLEKLEINSIYFSPVNLGSGYVQTQHGLLPVPPPAVAELMTGIPVYNTEEPTELLTPTGAAILTTLGKCLPKRPQLVYEKVGSGLGQKELKFHPNILRAFYGEEKLFEPARQIQVVEATIDDSSPQLLGNFINQALSLGALEAYLTPVVMKKNRLGTKLTLIAETDKIDKLIEAVFRETTTIGVRYFPVERRVLRREVKEIQIQGQKVRVKVSYLGEEPVNIQPEFDDCLKASEKLQLPLKKIMNLAIKKIY
ncbi:MAG: nickel pincer cofactor biosynthesis protein LarC [Candidatus Aminicenantes bacterium]|nr:nickel pincer cofactor biosynthesis protein LarC [Candidatus Aminicenantes bacterium]